MPSLLELDYSGRKQFIFDQLRTIPEWNDIDSLDDFTMEQNKGTLFGKLSHCRWTNEYHLQSFEKEKL
mgnify:CR=1 FL=1